MPMLYSSFLSRNTGHSTRKQSGLLPITSDENNPSESVYQDLEFGNRHGTITLKSVKAINSDFRFEEEHKYDKPDNTTSTYLTAVL